MRIRLRSAAQTAYRSLGITMALITCAAARPAASQDLRIADLAASGRIPVLTVLADFSDEPFRPDQDTAWISSLMYGSAFPNVPDFFRESGDPTLQVVPGPIVGPLRYSDPSQPPGIDSSSRWCAFNTFGSDNRPRCPGTTSTEGRARARVLQLAAASGIDFNEFDRNGDGQVSMGVRCGPVELLALWIEGSPGAGAASRPIPSFRPAPGPGQPRQPLLCGEVAGVGDETSGIEVILHELVHSFGAVDLYGRACLNGNSLMGCGVKKPPAFAGQDIRHVDPWHKIRFGWVNPTVLRVGRDFAGGSETLHVAQPGTAIAGASQPTSTAVVLANPAHSQAEYFILEYRSSAPTSGAQRAYDQGAGTDGGLVVWHALTGSALNGVPYVRFQPTNFTQGSGGWRVGLHPRRVADINGDGIGDLVGFGGEGVLVMQGALNPKMTRRKVQFGPLVAGPRDFSAGNNWSPDRHVRELADVNGDGRADIVGFGQTGVYVALSRSTVDMPAFGPTRSWISGDFAYEGLGWRVERHVRTLGDVNGDGRADLVGFGERDVVVALAHTTEDRFLPSRVWLQGDLTYQGTGGWRVEEHVRTVGDVNGDGRADLVGFGDRDVVVALAHPTENRFMRSRVWLQGDLTYQGAGGWRVERHVRTVGDVNGDGRADLVGFGDRDVLVALAHATEGRFLRPQVWLQGDFTYQGAGNWRVDRHVRLVSDADGDGAADIIAMGDAGVDVRTANPSTSQFSRLDPLPPVFSVAPMVPERRGSGNRMGVLADFSGWTSGQADLHWMSGRPAFSVRIVEARHPSYVRVVISPRTD